MSLNVYKYYSYHSSQYFGHIVYFCASSDLYVIVVSCCYLQLGSTALVRSRR